MDERVRVAVCVALFALLASGLAFRITHAELRHRSEKRTVAIAAEMLETGAWLVPTLRGEPRLQKPPLYAWLTAAAATLAGEPSLVALRAVSVAAGLSLVALVFVWGYSLGGFRVALGSALALAAMGQFWSSSTHATADIVLTLFGTAALCAFERRHLPAFALLLALALLTKATAALVNVLVPVALWAVLTDQARRVLEPRVLAWLSLATLIGVAWYFVVLAIVPGAPALLREFFFVPLGAGHSDLASDHYHSVFWYLPRVLGATAPAVLLLPFVIRAGVRTGFWRDAPRLRFLATSALALFVAWSLVPQKGRHYLLPILPLFALLCGALFAPDATPRIASSSAGTATRSSDS